MLHLRCLFFKPGLQAQRLHHPVWDENELLGGAGIQYAARDARQLRHLRLARQRSPPMFQPLRLVRPAIHAMRKHTVNIKPTLTQTPAEHLLKRT